MTIEQRRLGAGGPRVGAIGLGCWSFADAYGPASDEESLATLARTLELGATHWDTADVYGLGRSEELIGRFLRQRPEARDRVVIATKGGIKRKPGSSERSFDNSDAHIRGALEGSLRRLGVEQVALYYIHRRDQTRPIEEVMETLLALRREGKIGGIGFSEIAPGSLRRAAAVGPVMAVQSEYSLWTRGPDLGMLQATAEVGAAFVAFSPLGRGMLTGTVTTTSGFGPQDFRRHNPRFLEPSFGLNVKAVRPLGEIARDKGVSPGQVALAWVLARGSHLIAIPGTRSPTHLAENVAAAGLRLTADDLARIERELPPGFAHGDRYSEAQAFGAERYG